ncbi:MAG: RNA 2',3'-cyclic phosphodiesterase [Myxococcota bacterium]
MDDDARVRAFLAVPLDEASRSVALAWQHAVREALRADGEDVDALRWVPAEALHVTLHFLGNVAGADLPVLGEAAERALVGVCGFPLRFEAPTGFPQSRRPRVVVLPARPQAPLADLAARLRDAVAAWVPMAEDRPYRPHLTLARVRRGKRVRLPSVTASVTTAADASVVTECVLFRSDLSAEGARYSPLARFPLEAPEAGGSGDGASAPVHP